MGYIKENPIEEVNKPEKNKFVDSFYSAEEVNKLIEIIKGTKLELPILFAFFMFSDIANVSDFDGQHSILKTILLLFTIMWFLLCLMAKKDLIAKDNLKTAASIRTLPLDFDIKKRLIEIKKSRKQSKSKEWQNYIMLDESGFIIKRKARDDEAREAFNAELFPTPYFLLIFSLKTGAF